MSRFVVAIFPDEAKTQQATLALRTLYAQSTTELYGSAIIARNTDGELSAQKICGEGLRDSVVGALLGGLAGLAVGPLAAAVGAASGAVAGLSAAVVNQRTEETFADRVSRELAPGKAVIVAEVSDDGMRSLQTLVDAIGGALVYG